MSRLLRTVPILLGLAAAPAAVPLGAQPRPTPPFQLSLGAVYEVTTAMPLDPWDRDLVDRPYDHSISSWMASVGFLLPKLFGDGYGLSVGLGYGSTTVDAVRTAPMTIDYNGIPATATARHDVDVVMPTLSLDLLALFNVGESGRLEVGPYGTLGFSPDVRERQTIIAPAGASFADGSTTRSDSVMSAEEAVLQGGLALRVSYELPLFNDLRVRPFLIARGALVGSGEGELVGVLGSFGGGIAIALGGAAPPELTGEAELGMIPEVLPATSVDLYTQTPDGRSDTLTLTQERTLRRIEVPLSLRVSFERSSAALPQSLTGRDEAAAFDEGDLIGLDPAGLRSRSLDVIAGRLRSSASSARIIGSAASGEPAWFAEARARELRRYLSGAWGIDSARLTIETAADGGAWAELRPDDPVLTGPVITEWIEQQIHAPAVGVEPRIDPRRAVRSWRVSVMHGDREIGVVRNASAPEERTIDMSMALRSLSRSEASRDIGAELVVEDSTGAAVVARDVMAIRFADSADADLVQRFLGEYVVALSEAAETAAGRIVATLPPRCVLTVHAPSTNRTYASSLENSLRSAALASGRIVEIRADTSDADAVWQGDSFVAVRASGEAQ